MYEGLLPIVAFLLLLGVRRIPKDERLVVFRAGRRLPVHGPGVVWLIPFVDRTFKIRLEDKLPQWQYMPAEQLRERVEGLASAIDGEGPSTGHS